MYTPPYDILKKDGRALVWVEAVDDIEAAKSLIEWLACQSASEYVVFDQRTRQIVASAAGPISDG